MIVCSCNEIDTAKIKKAVERITEPNERTVLTRLGWNPECATCTKVLIEEIRRVMKENTHGA